ncbi:MULTISPECIES: circularly permuted type 2 ATP-grasp protein [unclassified Neptuniibacter]|uniref:circularly permuted type 2 ATP-grasp protein n=1 Tax=unclassified Neptuniibacter TaxID=2630693 RepID=UPI0025EBD6BA|nr:MULTISPECIES: circularly permuted type 2 ATP-grasp protein [unclassified Neptuniibacter]
MQNQSQSVMSEPSSNFSVPDGHYNEAFDLGLPRSHWQYLLESIETLGHDGLQDRHKKAERILRDDGATYNLASGPLDSKTWELDPIPMLIPSEEWSLIEAGLTERAELLNLILKDIYGPRELIRQAVIPPEIIYSHPGFLRQCQDIQLPNDHQLTLHAADMIRGADGKIIIIGDRTQSPSGAGYALENRTVLSRVVPSLFRDSQVHRLSHFFQSLRNTLASLAKDKTDDPLIVILTPGAYSETYFEHTYLSNYLGYPLVQGSDLIVRDGCVWLKSLNGLSKVNVIMRRVDDIYCDPVELKSNSYLGIPGLLEVIRNGNVAVSNPLGSGILETPALLKYMPQISQHFLGRDLKLPSVDTWWCGDKSDLNFIKSNLDSLIIKPAMRKASSPSVYGHMLTAESRSEILARIEASPHEFVAQSYVTPSYLPAWQDNEILTRPSIFRSFTVSNQVANQSTYTVMAGGLTRVGLSQQATVVTNQAGSQSKDTWILASEPEKQTTLIEDNSGIINLAHEANLPSRVIENLFWMGRYAERAESNMRLMRTVFMQMNGIEPLPEKSKKMLLQALSQQTNCLPGFMDIEKLDNPDQELIDIILDSNRSSSIKSSLLALLTCSEEVKEMLSADTHRIINDIRDNLFELERSYISGLPSAPEESLDPLVTTLLAMSGLSHESMLQGVGWKFQEIGRRTERALQTARLIQSLLTTALPQSQQQQILESVLLSVEALITFRRRYRTHTDVAHGLELLMLDETNPRSIIYQLQCLLNHFKDLPQPDSLKPGLSPGEKRLIQSLSNIQMADLDAVSRYDTETQSRGQLQQLLKEVIKHIEDFSSVLSDQYFDHQSEPQQLEATQGIVFL